MIRSVLPAEVETICHRITSMNPWLRLKISADELITGLSMDTMRRVLVYEGAEGIAGAVIYRPKHASELLFFHNFGPVLAERHSIKWPCEWQDIPDTGYIGSLAVFDGATGRGIGRELIRAAEEKICEAGNQTVYLSVSDFNDGAQRFYLRHGYERIGIVQGRRSIEHLMEKVL